MRSRDFCYWLQGYFELHPEGVTLDAVQVQKIKNHLAMVFFHEIDPAMGDKAHQEALQRLHDYKGILDKINPVATQPFQNEVRDTTNHGRFNLPPYSEHNFSYQHEESLRLLREERLDRAGRRNQRNGFRDADGNLVQEGDFVVYRSLLYGDRCALLTNVTQDGDAELIAVMVSANIPQEERLCLKWKNLKLAPYKPNWVSWELLMIRDKWLQTTNNIAALGQTASTGIRLKC